jgi:hypothetical protein
MVKAHLERLVEAVPLYVDSPPGCFIAKTLANMRS